MIYKNLTVDEIERLAYLEPHNAQVQRAFGARCIEEVDQQQDEIKALEDEVGELQSELTEARSEGADA